MKQFSYLCTKEKVMIQYSGFIGTPEIIMIVLAIVLLFGGKKIPELAKGLGKGIREFKKVADEGDLAKDLKDVASDVRGFKEDIDKVNPKKIFKETK